MFKSTDTYKKWNTYRITIMSNLFNGQKDFNENIKRWNVRIVTIMEALLVTLQRIEPIIWATGVCSFKHTPLNITLIQC